MGLGCGLGCINGILSVIGLIISFYFMFRLFRISKGSGKQVEIYEMIKGASFVYLRKQYQVIWGVALFMGIIVWKIFGSIATSFFGLGVLSSTLAGFIAMFIAVNGNVRTVESAKNQGLSGAFKVAIYSGAGASFFLNSVGILSVIPSLYFGNVTNNLICLMIGVSLVSVFARLGGGIFTKGADVGADMVGKTELGLPEDSPQNPAVIADNVGDNVGDTAGMGADLFETYVVSIVSCIMIAMEKMISGGLFIGITLCSLGLFTSIIPVFFMKFKNVWKDMDGYFNAAASLFIIGVLALSKFDICLSKSEALCVVIGASCVIGILKTTEYYTSCGFSPVKQVAEASKSGDGSNIIAGLSYGFKSVFIPVLFILISVLICFHLAGVWGIALGVIGITALSPAILLLDIFGPVSDNAGGIAEMSNLPPNIREITDELDAVGNTTKAITKGYAIGSAIFASLIMFFFFQFDLFKIKLISLTVDLFDPFVVIGLFAGCLLPFLFSGLSMSSVGEAAQAVVSEVRTQVKENPDILTGKVAPNYNKTVEFLTNFAIKKMVLPGLLPVISLFCIYFSGYFFVQKIVFLLCGSMLLGVTLSGSLLSIFMTISGGLWDNAKKYVEQTSKKGTLQHKASVTGDTVGDPFKDTVGPSLNSFIKFTNVLAMLMIHIN